MGGSRTGTPTIISLARKICRVYRVLGGSNLAAETSPAFVAAVLSLEAACQALEALDDQPFQIDATGPAGPEDASG